MTAIDTVCREIAEGVDGAVACGVVDLHSGRLLGLHSATPAPALREPLGAVTMHLFRSEKVGAIERALRAHQGKAGTDDGPFEVHVLSRDHYHFARLIKGGKAAVLLVANRATNVGMGSAQMKAVIPKMEPHLR